MGRFSAYWMDLALSSRLVMHNYLEHAKNHFQHAEALQPGSAAYNLACIAALCHRPADAIHWLRSCQTHGTLPSEEHFRTDSNLDPIRDTPEFTAWWAEVFGRGDAAMG